jgi:hypothetical protein
MSSKSDSKALFSTLKELQTILKIPSAGWTREHINNEIVTAHRAW